MANDEHGYGPQGFYVETSSLCPQNSLAPHSTAPAAMKFEVDRTFFTSSDGAIKILTSSIVGNLPDAGYHTQKHRSLANVEKVFFLTW